MRTHCAVGTVWFTLSLFLLIGQPLVGRADTLFVSDTGNNTIEEFNSAGGTGTVFASTDLDNPSSGLAFDSSGNLYVANYGNNSITEFNSNAVGKVFAAGVINPQGLAVDAAGNVWVAANGYFIDELTGAKAVFNIAQDEGAPIGLAFDKRGNLYAADQYSKVLNNQNGVIEEFNTNGISTIFASSGVNYPTGLAFDKNGNLYVANTIVPGESNLFQNAIVKFNASGVGTVFASSGLDDPQGMAFDSSGNLYVANEGNGTVEKFDTNGVGTVFASGLIEPVGLAFQPVPEPSTWALLAIGSIVLFRRRSHLVHSLGN